MQAKDVMTTQVISVSETSTVYDVALTLLDCGISAAPVLDSTGQLVGIVSEGDLMHRAEAGTGRQRSWWLSLFADSETLAQDFVKEHSRKVADVMTRKVITASPDTSLGGIATLLEKNRIKRVPILEDSKLVGIVSRANLLQALATAYHRAEPTTMQDDSKIRDAILSRLKAEPWSPSLLNVIVQDGAVDLWGFAGSESQKEAARVAAELVPGVVTVKDNIVLRQSMNNFG